MSFEKRIPFDIILTIDDKYNNGVKIALKSGRTRTAIYDGINELHKKGIIETFIGTSKRVKNVRLTKKGIKLKKELIK